MSDQNVQAQKEVPNAQAQSEVPAKKEPDKKKRSVTISQEMKLNEFRDVVENTFADSFITETAGKYGYDSQRLQEGKTLLENTVNLYEGFKNKQKDQILKYKEFTGAWSLARKTFSRFINTAALAFAGSEELLDRVGARSIKATPFGVGVAKAKLFYNNIEQMPDVLSVMEKYNVTLQELQDGKQQVLNAEKAESRHKEAKAESQKAAVLKILEFKKLQTWITDYRKVMRVGLKVDAQLLEKLGIRVPTPR